MTNDTEVQKLLDLAGKGDQQALHELLERYRGKLHRMVELRMDRRMQARVDASDVLQEAYLEVSQKLLKYQQNPTVPFFVWLRFVASQTLTHFHQFHLGTKRRDARLEVSLFEEPLPEASSVALAAQLLGDITSPSQAADRAELKARLQEGLDRLDPIDREVLALRHFEQLTVVEIAQVLGIKPPAASKRYIRAVIRLRDVLKAMGIDWGREDHGSP
jgi:RNA polymerase sigma-70 factor (ECF subfamily)